MRETIVPQQEEGSSLDVDYSFKAKSKAEACRVFRRSVARLLNVNDWDKICGPPSAKFDIIDEQGLATGAGARVGDYFRISIPAPGPREGDGFDWVRVETIDACTEQCTDEEHVSMRVRPTSSPENNKEGVAHFFGPEATSTFRVKRKGRVVTASVHGRNETANADTESVTDKVRNAVVSLGARAGLSAVQWKSLVRGIIEGEKV
jgi:hypothetical protein